MKTDILNLIPEKYLPDADIGSAVVRKVASSYIDIAKPEESKDWRGFNHGITARLLCPARYIDQFKRDAEAYVRCLICCICVLITKYRTRRDLKQRRLRLIDREGYPFFPVFLYDEDMMDGTATKGLFRGPLLVKVNFVLSANTITNTHSQAYRYIFLGPSQSHAASAKRSKKKGNAAIHGMRAVKPPTICYVAIQVTRCILARSSVLIL